MKRILVVEDELYLQKTIKELLEKYGYHAITASGLSDAMHYVLNMDDIDLFLLDVWLPDGDGFKLCRHIRRHSLNPILFLTACNDEESVVKGLNLGGDDYISKPFRAAELISRIQANLRRQNTAHAVKILRGGEIKLDNQQGCAYKNGENLNLGTMEYQLLLILMQNARRIVKRELLLEKLWDNSGKFVEDNTLSVNMSRLRRKAGAEYIETIRGFGYRFTKQVEEGLDYV
ncbi:response regulator transcription factor [Lachnospiraceae bacterium 46-15]